MDIDQLVQQTLKDVGDSITEFGSYTFRDKGLCEVMDTTALDQQFSQLSTHDAAAFLVGILEACDTTVVDEYDREIVLRYLMEMSEERDDVDQVVSDQRLIAIY